MRLWGDCEFIDTGTDLILLSVGVVREDGAEFYAEPRESAGMGYLANDFVREHVLPYLAGAEPLGKSMGRIRRDVRPVAQIAAELREFADVNDDDDPEWWTAWGAYDWVLISQLFGPLHARPDGWPWQPRPLEYVAERLGVPVTAVLPEPQCCPVDSPLQALPTHAHHALAGAWWTKTLYDQCVARARDLGLADRLGLS